MAVSAFSVKVDLYLLRKVLLILSSIDKFSQDLEVV